MPINNFIIMHTPEEELIITLTKLTGKSKEEVTEMVKYMKAEMLHDIPNAGKQADAAPKKTTHPQEHSPKDKKQGPILKYTLRITLMGIEPAIWREVAVPSNIPLDILGSLILDLMGWENEHLSEFQVGKGDFYEPRRQRDLSMESNSSSQIRHFDQEDYTLQDVLTKVSKSILWQYDFGDDWTHEVVLSSIDEYNDEKEQKITFIGGKRACPPEDCGGAWGYQQLIELHKKMKAGKRLSNDEKDRYEWFCDKRFDPERLSIANCTKIANAYNKK